MKALALERTAARTRGAWPSWRPMVVTLGVLAAALAVLSRLHALDVAALGAALRGIGAAPVALGVAGGFGVVALQALRWWVVTRPVLRVSYGQAYGALLVGGLLNAVLPARAGDLLRVQYLADRARVSRATLYGTELVDFWTDKSGWLPAFALVALTGAPPSWMYRAVAVMTGLAAALLATVLWLRRRLAARSASARGDARAQDSQWIARFAAGLSASSPARLFVASVLLAALPWLWETLAIHAVGLAAGLPVSPLLAFVILTAFNLAMVVPVPGGMGVHEAASTAVLVAAGIPIERAMAFAVAYHASQLAPYVVGGALGLLRWRLASAPAPAPTPAPTTHAAAAAAGDEA